MKGETMGIVTELRSTCETKLPHIKTKKANENKEVLNLKSYSRSKIKKKHVFFTVKTFFYRVPFSAQKFSDEKKFISFN